MLALAVSRHSCGGDFENAGDTIEKETDMNTLLTMLAVLALWALVWVAWKVYGEQRSQTKISTTLLHLMADAQGVKLPPDHEKVAKEPAGQFLHWENYGVRPTLPDSREVEPERE